MIPPPKFPHDGESESYVYFDDHAACFIYPAFRLPRDQPEYTRFRVSVDTARLDFLEALAET